MSARRTALLLLAAVVLLAGALSIRAPGLPEPPGEVRASLLALGDAGAPPEDDGGHQGAVGEALAAEDRRRPADALLLLGDNFYPDGLQAHELEARVRFNLVRPYCRFVALDAPRSAEVADACPLPPDRRRPTRPILAVLGNHDYTAPESPRLQREVVPRYVANWRVPERAAEVVELEGGLSLILMDSHRFYDEEQGTRVLRRALERARGPWRILAMHHPLVPSDHVPWERDYQQRIGAVLRATRDHRVHLVLTGHEHNLALVEMDDPYAILHVIAGAGGGTLKDVAVEEPGLRFGAQEPGFARVDLVARDGAEHLRVTLLGVRHWPALGDRPRRLAVWSVDDRGDARSEAPIPHR